MELSIESHRLFLPPRIPRNQYLIDHMNIGVAQKVISGVNDRSFNVKDTINIGFHAGKPSHIYESRILTEKVGSLVTPLDNMVGNDFLPQVLVFVQ